MYYATNRLISLVRGEVMYTYTSNALGERLSQIENGEISTYTPDLNRGLTKFELVNREQGIGQIAQSQLTILDIYL